MATPGNTSEQALASAPPPGERRGATPRRKWGQWTGWVRRNPRRAGGILLGLLGALLLISRLIPPSVETVTLERREVVETLVTTGRVQTLARVEVGTSLVGQVRNVLVETGERVEAGQLLIELDDAELRAGADQASARVLEAQAALGRVGAVALPTAVADLEAAEVETRLLERDAGRLQTLFEAGGISRQELEDAQRAAQTARSRLEGARASTASVAAGGPDRRAVEAGVAQAREALAAAMARLELTRLRAPSAGTVLIREVEPGDAVQPGLVLLEIALDGPTELIIFPDERTVSRLTVGQPAIASADAFPRETFAASVSRIAPVVDPDQGTVEVRLDVPAPPAYLLADMTISVNIELDRRAGAPTLPLGAVRAALTDTAWVLAVRGGRAERVPVAVGLRDSTHIEIVSGLESDEQVYTGAGAGIEPGDRVRASRR